MVRPRQPWDLCKNKDNIPNNVYLADMHICTQVGVDTPSNAPALLAPSLTSPLLSFVIIFVTPPLRLKPHPPDQSIRRTQQAKCPGVCVLGDGNLYGSPGRPLPPPRESFPAALTVSEAQVPPRRSAERFSGKRLCYSQQRRFWIGFCHQRCHTSATRCWRRF